MEEEADHAMIDGEQKEKKRAGSKYILQKQEALPIPSETLSPRGLTS